MDAQDLGARCAEILNICLYANIATCGDDQPWNTPATAIPDSHLDIYWSSWIEAVHSKNILANPRAFITYYDSTRPRGTNNLRCLYLRCEAAVVQDHDEARAAHELLYPGEKIQLDNFFDSGLRRFYRARPLQAWLNCLSEQQVQPDTIDMRREVSLQDIRAAY
ncbi:pyridoxamine 5'-phosphate oxidase family protein [Salinisphaera hydrothermalis]|uniref:pyridoxamine 5'-phosphate oxidase family protein n=1 Tax=Salinisphaera hydrothermalis TaxID=563188 RepID=UPI0033418A22